MILRSIATFFVLLLIADTLPATAQTSGIASVAPRQGFTIDPILAAGENPCPEGQYRDYSDLTTELSCKDLLRDTGFDWDTFEAALPSKVIEVEYADWDSIATALIEIGENGGGTVRLPAGTVEASRLGLRIPPNTLLEGAGMGQTIIEQVPGLGIFNMREGNIVLRDFTLRNGTNPVQASYSNNLLFERLEITGAALNGLTFSYSTDVTVRYIYAHANEQNGILSKDCFPGSIANWKCPINPEDPEDPAVAACRDALTITQDLCEEAIQFVADSVKMHPIEPGALWTSSYAVYSNHLANSLTSHGAALHARYGEVAGNWFDGNVRGMKLPDSEDIWIHHNLFENSLQFALHIYAVIQDHPPTNHRIFANQILNSGDFAMRLEGVSMLVLINNHYSGNFACYEPIDWCTRQNGFWQGKDAIRLGAANIGGLFITPDVFVCPQFQDATLEIAGDGRFVPGIAPDELCTLAVPTEDDHPLDHSAAYLYPNPSLGAFHLSYSPTASGTTTVELYNTLGRRVRELYRGDHSRSAVVDISADVNELPSGMYFARIADAAGIRTIPVVIRH